MLLNLCPQFLRYQVKRLFVHRAVLDCVDRSLVGSRVTLEPSFQQRHNGRLAASNRTHQKQDTLSHLQALSCALEILHNVIDGLFDSEQLIREKPVTGHFLASTLVKLLCPRRENHVADARVREFGDFGVLYRKLKIVTERAFPGKLLSLTSVCLEAFSDIKFIFFHLCPPFRFAWVRVVEPSQLKLD